MWIVSAFYSLNAKELNAMCAQHQGVQQVTSTWIDPMLNGNATVVCKDGTAVQDTGD